MSAGGLAAVRQAPRGPVDAAPNGNRERHDRLPADGLLHPISILGLGLLLVNDQVLKAAWPGPLTGKLSDIAGLIFFPILVLSAGELAMARAGRWRRPGAGPLVAAVVGTGVAFALVKVWPPAALAAGWLLGSAQWLLALPVRALTAVALPPVVPSTIVVDPTDLLALPCLVIAVWIGRSRLR